MNKVKIIVVRHGQTDWNKKKIIQGWEQTTLNQEGVEYTYCIANYLSYQKFDVILTSDLLRAQQTADIFSQKLNLPVCPLKELRERYLGKLQGTYENNISVSSIVESTMEPAIMFTRRIVTIFRRIAAGEWGSSVLVITHGGPIEVLRHCCPGGAMIKCNIYKALLIECANKTFSSIAIL